jgi:hypothetical protein
MGRDGRSSRSGARHRRIEVVKMENKGRGFRRLRVKLI